MCCDVDGFATFCLLSPPKKTISFLYMFYRKIKTRLIIDEPRFGFVRVKGLEPPRLSALDPKSSAATNYATHANPDAKVRIIFELQNNLSKK